MVLKLYITKDNTQTLYYPPLHQFQSTYPHKTYPHPHPNFYSQFYHHCFFVCVYSIGLYGKTRLAIFEILSRFLKARAWPSGHEQTPRIFKHPPASKKIADKKDCYYFNSQSHTGVGAIVTSKAPTPYGVIIACHFKGRATAGTMPRFKVSYVCMYAANNTMVQHNTATHSTEGRQTSTTAGAGSAATKGQTQRRQYTCAHCLTILMKNLSTNMR